jgi:ATP-dependent RNA helicase DeaD
MSFSFSELREEIRKALREMGFSEPTPIQETAIPPALEGMDLLIQAKTGTGKTAAFALPLLEKLGRDETALVLAPTRELAIQIRNHIRDLSRFMKLKVVAFYGGTPVLRDLRLLSRETPHLAVGTPGRIKDLISRGALDTERIAYLVLDEMDLMLDMGFIEDIEWLVSRIPRRKQTFLVSATVPPEIKEVAVRFLRENFRHVRAEVMKPKVREVVLRIGSEMQKVRELERILRENREGKVIVFVRRRKDAKELAQYLRKRGFKVIPLHGDMPQKKRERAIGTFRRGGASVLVATDVASRGLDIGGVSLVVNYHIPEDPRVYIHRIGRTARLGGEGTAISLVSPSERANLLRIERLKKTAVT